MKPAGARPALCFLLLGAGKVAGLAARRLLTVWPAAGRLPPWPDAPARLFAELVVTCNSLAWPFAMVAGVAFLWRGRGRWLLGLLEWHLAVFVVCLAVL